MVELVRTHPLEAWVDALAAVDIAVEPFVATVDVRSVPPAAPTTWVASGSGYAVWLGPDEWLLTSPDEAPEELEARVRAEVPGGAVVDVSAQRITLRLTGERARHVLAKGCAIDLHPRAFAPGSSAQTTLGQAGVVLLARDEAVDVLVRSSFAAYLAEWLLDATLEYR